MDYIALLILVLFSVTGLITCAISLKIIIWAFNGLFFGKTPDARIAPPSFLKSIGLNFLTFLIISSIVGMNLSAVKALVGNLPEYIFVLVQTFEAIVGFAVLWMILKWLLPTTWLRAFLLAFVHSIA